MILKNVDIAMLVLMGLAILVVYFGVIKKNSNVKITSE